MKFPFPANRQFATMALALLSTGFVIGLGTTYSMYQGALSRAYKANKDLVAVNDRQSQVISQLGTEARSLFDEPAPAAIRPTAPSPAAEIAPVAKPAMPVEPPKQPVAQVVAPARPAVAQPRPAPPRPAAQTATSSPSADTPPQPPRQQAAPAKPTTPLAASVTMEQAGIAGIDTAGIRFRSGRQINVGGEFPTGEKLISVNPGEGRIVTDRRVIVLTKPQPAQ